MFDRSDLRAADRFDCFETICIINKKNVLNDDDELKFIIKLIFNEELVDLELIVLKETEEWDDDDEVLNWWSFMQNLTLTHWVI